MLKLKNIKIENDIIEADYIPEDSKKAAHVSYNITNQTSEIEVIKEFGSVYGRMAINGLKRTLEELSDGIIDKAPEERLVMWG